MRAGSAGVKAAPQRGTSCVCVVPYTQNAWAILRRSGFGEQPCLRGAQTGWPPLSNRPPAALQSNDASHTHGTHTRKTRRAADTRRRCPDAVEKGDAMQEYAARPCRACFSRVLSRARLSWHDLAASIWQRSLELQWSAEGIRYGVGRPKLQVNQILLLPTILRARLGRSVVLGVPVLRGLVHCREHTLQEGGGRRVVFE